MDNFSKEEQLQQLSEIRSLMERSSRFISLSGLSGVGAGFTALIGSAIAYWRIEVYTSEVGGYSRYSQYTDPLLWELIFIALGILVVALSVGAFFTLKEAKKQGQSIWDKSSQQLIVSLTYSPSHRRFVLFVTARSWHVGNDCTSNTYFLWFVLGRC